MNNQKCAFVDWESCQFFNFTKEILKRNFELPKRNQQKEKKKQKNINEQSE